MSRFWGPSRESPRKLDAWGFYEALGDRNRDGLSQVEREVAAICDLRQEVNSGGFDSYLRYWGGDTATVALTALAKVLGQEWADLLASAMALVGPEYPTESDAREVRIDAQDVADDLAALDARFYELEQSSDADARVSAYLAGAVE